MTVVWIDTLTAALGALGAITAMLVAVVAAVRWVVRRELQPVRDRLDTWIDEHQQRHADERQQIAAAFRRNELSPPDGWDRPRSKQAGGSQ